jgi:hypothetical protein
MMSLLCDRSLLLWYTNSTPLIDSKIIKEAMKDLDYVRSSGTRTSLIKFPRKTSWPKTLRILFFVFSIIVFLVSLNFLIPLLFWR